MEKDMNYMNFSDVSRFLFQDYVINIVSSLVPPDNLTCIHLSISVVYI